MLSAIFSLFLGLVSYSAAGSYIPPALTLETIMMTDTLPDQFQGAEAIIRQNIAQFSRDLVAGDFEAITQAYTSDGILLPNSGDILRGEAAIRNYWTPPADRDSRTVYHRILPEEIKIEGTTAYDWGYYEGRTRRGDGTEVEWRGKYVIIWKEVEPSVWKIYLDSWSRI